MGVDHKQMEVSINPLCKTKIYKIDDDAKLIFV